MRGRRLLTVSILLIPSTRAIDASRVGIDVIDGMPWRLTIRLASSLSHAPLRQASLAPQAYSTPYN